MAVGILVHGSNHFIVRGPVPDLAIAKELAREWSIIRIGEATPQHLSRWSISTRELREELSWAIVVPGDGEISAAVAQLLTEIAGRGIEIKQAE